jgi:hypothetical protein
MTSMKSPAFLNVEKAGGGFVLTTVKSIPLLSGGIDVNRPDGQA